MNVVLAIADLFCAWRRFLAVFIKAIFEPISVVSDMNLNMWIAIGQSVRFSFVIAGKTHQRIRVIRRK
jgi:hypothetical protein